MSRFPFSDRPRLWGTAVSHYQIEGSDPCDWSSWEAAGRTRGGACGDAAGSWQRYEGDVDAAADVGANAFRFSVSWSRIEPQPGVFDEAALRRYSDLVDHLAAREIEPVVTLFHYTHPTWFHERTPWHHPASVDAFARFAREVARTFGSRVRLYTIFNEPLVFLLAGYVDAQIPPGLSDSTLAARALDHLYAAHVAAAASIREANPAAAISLAHNLMGFAPRRWWHPLDRLLASSAHRYYNHAFVEAFSTGRWNLLLPPATRIRGRRDDLAGSLDVLGVNFYSRLHLRCPGRRQRWGDFDYLDRSGRGLTDNGWEIVPEVFESLLVDLAKHGFPMLVTENGIADAKDALRPDYLREHAEAIQRAIGRGAPIHGYFHWSLVDNFEWLDGFEPRFGLYELDRQTFERRPRPSATLFRTLGREFLAGS